MGTHLVDYLSKNKDVSVIVTSRKERDDHDNIKYVAGNARDLTFMNKMVTGFHYDVIVDFMNYNYEEFEERYNILLDSCDHYIFLSSSRVYADCDGRIIESSPRLLETTTDAEFLSTNRYALRKAREEDMLRFSGKSNYTIVRPYVTYSNRRLQLGIYEKEEWLYRILNNKPIIISEGILDKITTLTFGKDVAYGIFRIALGNPISDAVHITTMENMTWMEVLKLYAGIIGELLGKKLNVYISPDIKTIEILYEGGYNTIYDRQWNRRFDNTKAEIVCGHIDYLAMREGLSLCLRDFLCDYKDQGNSLFLPINKEYEKEMDRLVKDNSLKKEIVQL